MADIINGVSCAGMRVLKLEEFDYDVGLTEVYDKKGFPLSFLLTAEKITAGVEQCRKIKKQNETGSHI